MKRKMDLILESPVRIIAEMNRFQIMFATNGPLSLLFQYWSSRSRCGMNGVFGEYLTGLSQDIGYTAAKDMSYIKFVNKATRQLDRHRAKLLSQQLEAAGILEIAIERNTSDSVCLNDYKMIIPSLRDPRGPVTARLRLVPHSFPENVRDSRWEILQGYANDPEHPRVGGISVNISKSVNIDEAEWNGEWSEGELCNALLY